MKIENKNNNINETSKTTLKQYRQNQILTNIKYHKIFLILSILVNIGLITFIIIYKTKINEIKNLATKHSTNINSKDKELSTKHSSIDSKIVNIAILNKSGIFRFSIIFGKSDEFNDIKNIISNYINKNNSENNLSIYTFFLYQSGVDADDYRSFMERISFFENILICVQAEKGNKFCIFFKKIIVPNNDNEFYADTKDIFLYLFETKKVYNFIGDNKKSISFKKDKLICLGDDEFVIYNEYWTKGGYINYPFKSFDLSNVDINALTEQNGEFNIKYLEIYSFLYLKET